MNNKNKSILLYLINLSFFMYFLILIVERVISVVLSLVNGIDLYGGGFNGYTYTLVFVSVAAFIIYLIVRCRHNIKTLFKGVKEDTNFNDICIASGILLLSGMVHTEYTIPVIQFVSYGILIVGILLQVVVNTSIGGDRVLHWLSFAYLVALSMAIPVMYRSMIEQSILFHILEGIAVYILVGVFTFLLMLVLNQRDDLLILTTIVLVVAFDTPLIILRWQEEINYFVLIFEALSFLIFSAGYIYKLKKRLKGL